MARPDLPVAIDLFSGVGMASLALRKSGFHVAGAIDINPYRCYVYSKNVSKNVTCADMRETTGAKILSNAGIARGAVDVLVGCPPCQAFSGLARTRGINPLGDDRSELVIEFARKINAIRPKCVIFENVQGLFLGVGRPYLDFYLEALNHWGYNNFPIIVDATYFAVPQHRKRTLVLSVKKDSQDDKQTAKLKDCFMDTYRRKTVRNAIAALPKLKPGKSSKDPLHSASSHSEKVMQMITNIPANGGSRKDLPKSLWLPCHLNLKGKKGAESVYGRMRWDSQAPTITTRFYSPSCGRFIHPQQDRSITMREAARLQTIPDYFDFRNEDGLVVRKHISEAIGDAVPPRMLGIILRRVRKHFFDYN